MGLAPYGEPTYAELIREKLLDLKDDGSFRMDMSYFNYCQGLTMTGPKFDDLFGGPPRKPEIADHAARDGPRGVDPGRHRRDHAPHARATCSGRPACATCAWPAAWRSTASATARSCATARSTSIWIQPAAGDAGGALGVALFIWHQLLGSPRTTTAVDSPDRLAPRAALRRRRRSARSSTAWGARYEHIADDDALCDRVAGLMADEKVVGWFQGRMEFGPRALGSRSIIGDARSEKMQTVMNLKIKFRESFRPFAPSVLQERVSEYFDMRPSDHSPYMLLVAPVRDGKRLPVDGQARNLHGLDKLKFKRSIVPAITHVDYSARVQTVDAERHGRYHKLLRKFESRTGCPVIINTSFNVRGEPIVCSPEHAYRCFMATNMDVLVLEDFVLLKDQQPNAVAHPADDYLAQFQLD